VSIFTFTDDILCKIKTRLYETIYKYKDFEESVKEGVKRDIESKSFKNLSQILFKLCIYMLLHEPQLTLGIQPYEKREFSYNYYNKTDFLNIEGFGNDQSACITILGPPMIRNYLPFQGIKPSVYIIPVADEEIIKSCEKNKAAKKVQQAEKVEPASNVNNTFEKAAEKGSSPVKTEKKCKEINNESEAQNNITNFTMTPPVEKQSSSKVSKVIPHGAKEQNTPVSNTKIPNNFVKFSKNIERENIVSDSTYYINKDISNNFPHGGLNEAQNTVNQCYNHPLSLNKKKFVAEKYDLEENMLKNNYRLISQQIKTSSKNSSKSCSLNTSLKNDPLKLSEINEAYENMIKTTQRQNSSRTTLNTIDQPLYRDSLNASKI
jgi:hypothetical protein